MMNINHIAVLLFSLLRDNRVSGRNYPEPEPQTRIESRWKHHEHNLRRELQDDEPCLQSCSVFPEPLSASLLDTCIDECKDAGHCCGNRLNGESPTTSNQRVSCANGCEFAYYSSTIAECKAACSDGNQNGCEYNHPYIDSPFSKCNECQEGCNMWPTEDECELGCELAASNDKFYKFESVDSCQFESMPRFLFAGQSNMEGNSRQAMPEQFFKIIKILNMDLPKKEMKKKLRKQLKKAEVATAPSARYMSQQLYKMRDFLTDERMNNPAENAVCSFTNPSHMDSLDCERPVDSIACGSRTNWHGKVGNFGPELMFAHRFPTLKTKFQGQEIAIDKVAVGGTEIYKHWSKEAGEYWPALVDTIQAAQGSIEAFVWFQGENDSFSDENMDAYQDNLTQFVADVREEIYTQNMSKWSAASDIPVVIIELGQWRYGTKVIDAQRSFVESDGNAILVSSGANDDPAKRLSAFYHFDAASFLIIGDRLAKAMKQLLKA